MASKKTAAKPEATVKHTLATIVAAGEAGTFTHPDVHGELVAAGLVEINPGVVNEHGTATRATAKGIQSMNSPAQTSAPVTSKFAIESGVAIPTISGRGKGGDTYPFALLEVNQSFFVANTEDKPNAAKSLASTVSSATARYAVADVNGATRQDKNGNTVPVTHPTRKFLVRSVEGGARVWRTA